MSTPKYSREQLRFMARHVLTQRDLGSPSFEVFLMMLMMRLGTFNRVDVVARIKELAQ